MLQRFWKPWFIHNLVQLARRAMQALHKPTPGFQPLMTSWGVPVTADPTRAIGHGIYTTGVYDLTVSEILARLISPGDLVVDAGANIGYMTLLSLIAAGNNGRVLSFEPHPDLFKVLQENVAATRKAFSTAESECFNVALGATPGHAELVLPSGFGNNDGIAHIQTQATSTDRTVTVPVDTLDAILKDRTVAVMKMDVEGFEPQVLRGAAVALAAKRIRHIVFEEHDIANSEVVRILTAVGYTVFSLGWTMSGPAIAPVAQGKLAHDYEPANYVATVNVDEMMDRCTPKGWRVLKKQFAKRL